MIGGRLCDTVAVTGYLLWIISRTNQHLAKSSAQCRPIIHKIKEGGLKSSKYFLQTWCEWKREPSLNQVGKLSTWTEMLTVIFINHKKSYPCNRPWRPIGLWDVEAPTFSLDNRLTHGDEVISLTRLPPFTRQEDSWYSFLLEADSTPWP
jgi:hypothetical protein